MEAGLELIYRKYFTFISELRHDLERLLGPEIVAVYGAPLLSFEEFCPTWKRWGQTEGLQQSWQQRFELGYHHVARELASRVRQALYRSSLGPCAADAA
jgi:hypothetical protein